MYDLVSKTKKRFLSTQVLRNYFIKEITSYFRRDFLHRIFVVVLRRSTKRVADIKKKQIYILFIKK